MTGRRMTPIRSALLLVTGVTAFGCILYGPPRSVVLEATRRAEMGIDESSFQQVEEATSTPGPTPTPSRMPRPTRTPLPSATPTITPIPDEAVEAAIRVFDEEMRYLLETNDTSHIAGMARGKALRDRLHAADIQEDNGCRWRYIFRGLEVLEIEYPSSTHAVATVELDTDGTVYCGTVERNEFAYEGPVTLVFDVEFMDGKWWVTNRELSEKQ